MATMETSFLGATTSATGSARWNHLSLNQQLITLLPIPHALQCDTSSSRSVYSSLGEISNTQPCLGKGGTCPVVLDERLLPSHSRGSRGLRNRHCSPFLPSSLSTFRQGKGQHTRCLLLSSHPALSGHRTVRGRARVAQSAFSTQQHTSSAASGPDPRGHKSSPLFSYRRPKSPSTHQVLEAPGLSHLQTPAMSAANTSIHRNLQAVPQSCPNVVVCISFLGNMSPRRRVGAAHVSKI